MKKVPESALHEDVGAWEAAEDEGRGRGDWLRGRSRGGGRGSSSESIRTGRGDACR